MVCTRFCQNKRGTMVPLKETSSRLSYKLENLSNPAACTTHYSNDKHMYWLYVAWPADHRTFKNVPTMLWNPSRHRLKNTNSGNNANHKHKKTHDMHPCPTDPLEFGILKILNKQHLNIFASSGYFVIEIQQANGNSHIDSAQAARPSSLDPPKCLKPCRKPATDCHLPVVELRLHWRVDRVAHWLSQSGTPNSWNLLAKGFLWKWTGTG